MKTIFVIIVSVMTLLQGSVTPVSAVEESFQFSPGANLFAYPVTPGSTYSAADLLEDLNNQENVSSIQHYNTETGIFETSVWKNNITSGADFPIQAEEGYIVHTSASFTYLVSGDRICPQVPLTSGLTVAAFPCAGDGYDAHQLLQDLGSAAIAVKTQSPADRSVLTAIRENDVISGDNFSIEHGHSYLVYTDSDVSWYPIALPAAPGNATGYAGDQLAILTWTPPAGDISGYNVYRTATSGSNYEKINSDLLQVTEYTDPGLANGTPWYYAISAVDQYGRETAFSSEVTVTPLANAGPTTITTGITTNTTWTLSGSPYLISTTRTVSPGITLTLEPGIVLQFTTGQLTIDGTLLAKGTADHPIVFQSGDGSWTGLSFEGAGSSNSILEYCRIEHASEPIDIVDSSPEISHCTILGTSSYGIELARSNAHIHHTTISGSYSSMYGIYMNNSSPLVEYNQISSYGYGIYMYSDSSPQILHNSITDFSINGLYLSGASSAQPYPTITSNIIETNRGGSSTYLLRTTNYYNNPAAGTHRTVNARNNYWGTIDPQIITASVVQWAGGTSDEPYVDFSEFLDGPYGTVVPGNFIPSGPLSAEELSWVPEESPYIILGHVLVANGDELVIAPGTEVQFAGGGDVYGYTRNRLSSLQIMGKLTAIGDPDSFIHLLSNTATPEKSDWYGIVFMGNSDSNSTVSYCVIEHAYQAIRCEGGSAAISNNDIIAGPGSGVTYAAGIRLQDANTSEISNNHISGYDYYDSSGIYMLNSDPTVTGNVFDANRVGINIRANSSAAIPITPVITSNEVINSTVNSFMLNGVTDDTKNPNPLINNNTIITPSVPTASFNTFGYGENSTIVINARNNWWGTYDAAAIAQTVDDKNDSSTNPLVDYRFFLNGAAGQPGTGNQVLGNLPAGTITWSTAGSPYQVMGDLNIPSGTTLTIEAGVEVWLGAANTVNVEGELYVNGSEGNLVSFTSGSMTEAPADWEGIRFIGTGSDNSVLSYCRIEGAELPIYMEDSSPEISHCDIVDASSTYYSIRLLRSDAHIHHSTISSNYDTDRGLYLDNSSPLIEYNLIAGMHDAIYLTTTSNPQILHNTLLDFSYTGIVCYGYGGNPYPTINNNTLQTSRGDSNTWLIRTSYYENDPQNNIVQTIDARNNYWGTADPQKINGAIDQWSGTNTDPIIDFSGFLDAPDGTAVTGHFISPGVLTELTWQPASGPYIILGHTIVANGHELTIAPGTEIRFLGGDESIFNTTRNVRSSLRIYGRLSASGTPESKIHFYSNHSEPTMGDWSGIYLYDNEGDSSVVSYSKIEHAYDSIYCSGVTPEISNNEIVAGPGSAAYAYGLRLESGCNATVTDNHISGFDAYYTYNGIYILDSSPTVSGNLIEKNYYGIHLKNGSPAISGNIIDHNDFGIRIAADNNTVTASTPAITSNAIVDSTAYSVYIYGYSSGDNSTSPHPVFTNNSFVTQFSPADSFYTTSYNSSETNIITIDAEENWWGTGTESEIDTIIRDRSTTSGAPIIDFIPFLTESPTPLLYHPLVSQQWISPNGDGTQEDVTISWQGSSDISNWTISVKDASGVVIRTEIVVGSLEWIWDGKDDDGFVVADGQYTLAVSGSNGSETVEREAGSVNVDTIPLETVQIDSPIEAQVLQNIFNIDVTVQDPYISNYTLEIGRGVSPVSWRQLQTGSVSMDQATLYSFESNTIYEDIIPSLITVGDLIDGSYTLRLTATDLAGNVSIAECSITFENIFITDVSVTELVVDLTVSQSAGVDFTIDKTADVTLQIYTEAEGEIDQLVREISQLSLAAGTHSFSWDGKNDSGQNVPVGGYIFVLSATTGTGLTDQFLPDPTLNVPAWSPISSYNASTNDWFTADCTMGNVPGRYRIEIRPSGETPFTVYTEYAAANETFLYAWDGRRPDKTLVDVQTGFFIYDTWSNNNMLIVRSSSAPEITGQAPAVNVKSNPFLVNFCYGEQTSILYNLDRQAEVTVTLLPVPLTDPTAPEAIILLDNQVQNAGDHTVTWNGSDVADIRHVLFSQEGLYNFVIEATSEGITSTARGVVSLYK